MGRFLYLSILSGRKNHQTQNIIDVLKPKIHGFDFCITGRRSIYY